MSATPGTPATPIRYFLYYRQGAELGWKQKIFDFPGDLTQAIARGRRHCEAIPGIKFLSVRPFLSDLDAEEKAVGADG